MLPVAKELCNIFCCPPIPSVITAKLAFVPPHPTYSIVSAGAGDPTKLSLEFLEPANWFGSKEVKSSLEVFYAITSKESRIVCIYLPAKDLKRHLNQEGATISNGQPAFTVLFSHGNAVDIGQMAWFLVMFACEFNVNVLIYDYSGYGLSSGRTLEKNLYADSEAALHQLLTKYNVSLDNIVLYGQSIGTAPTVHLASKYKVAGVVLHSPLMSGMRVICPKNNFSFCFDPFANIKKVALIESPTLIIHGEEDETIGIDHGMELHAKLKYPLNPAWVKEHGHNDIENSPDYAPRLHKFFYDDLRRPVINGISVAKEPSQAIITKPGTVNPAFVPDNTFRTPYKQTVPKPDPEKSSQTKDVQSRGEDLTEMM